MKCRQDRRQHILGNGGAGADAEFAAMVLGKVIELKLQVSIDGKNLLSMLKKRFSSGRQGYFASLAIKKFDLIVQFDLSDMLGDGRLGNVKLFCSFGEVQSLGDRMENLKSKIKHDEESLALFFAGVALGSICGKFDMVFPAFFYGELWGSEPRIVNL